MATLSCALQAIFKEKRGDFSIYTGQTNKTWAIIAYVFLYVILHSY